MFERFKSPVQITRPKQLGTVIGFAVLLVFFLLFQFAPHLFTKWYDVSDVNIDACVSETNPNNLEISQQQTFNFHGWGSYEAVYVGIGKNLSTNGIYNSRLEEKSINSVSINGRSLSSTSWQSSFEDKNPAYEAWSYDPYEGNLWFFFNDEPSSATISFKYEIPNTITHFNDVNQIYWKYAADWEVDLTNVTCTLHVAPKADTSTGYAPYAKGEDLRAWGHGSEGTVEINDTDGTIVFHNDYIAPKGFAEARVIYPRAWADNTSQELTNVRNYDGLSLILSQEKYYAEIPVKSLATYEIQAIWISALLLLAIVLVTILVLVYFHAKKRRYYVDYFRDIPDKNACPAEIGYLLRRQRFDSSDIVANILDMAERKIITISEKDGVYTLTRNRAAEKNATPADNATLNLLFEVCGLGDKSIEFADISGYAEVHPKEFSEGLLLWKSKMKEYIKAKNWKSKFAPSYEVRSVCCVILGVLIFTAVSLSPIFSQSLVVMVCAAIVGIALELSAILILRFQDPRTPEGDIVYNKALGLRRWLLDFTNLKESIPTDAKVWGEFLVYAYLFGISEKVVKELRLTLPELFESETTYIPTVFAPHHSLGGSVGGGFTSVVGTSFAHALSSSMSTAFSNSGGGNALGGGGGFSGGGGGGCGGGGGGAR